MSEGMIELEARRRMLVLRSERLRADLGTSYGEFESRLGMLDRIFSIARGIVSPSLLFGVGGVGLALLRGVRPFKWATRGILIFSLVRRILGAVRAVRPSAPPARR